MEPSMTEFDTLTYSHSLQMLKAALPYIDASRQKNLILCIKLLEFRNAMSLLAEDNSQLRACSDESEENRLSNMLSHLRQFCTDKEKETLDLLLNFYQAFQLFSSYRASSASNAEDASGNRNQVSMTDILKNLLSPEQQAAFDGYRQILESN